MVLKSDPYLLDYGCVRVNCFVDDQMRLIVIKLSWNRDILEELICNDFRTDLHTVIDDLISDDIYSPCHGFSDQDTSGVFDVFYRLRKNDIPFIILEKYNGSILYRARNCKFVFQRKECNKDKNDIFRNQCEDCRDFYTQMDMKYAFGRFTKTNNENITKNENTVLDDQQNLKETVLPIVKEIDNKCSLEENTESERVETLLEDDANKRSRRDSRSRKSGSKYKDFVVELGTTEELNIRENTTSTNDDTNEEIENIENLPLNVRTQEVQSNDFILIFNLYFLDYIHFII